MLFELSILGLVLSQTLITETTVGAEAIQNDECGVDYFCLSFENCEFGGDGCPTVAWKLLGDSVEVKLRFSSPTDSWVAIGFSRDRTMGDDDVFYCERRGNVVAITSAYTIGMEKPVNMEETRLSNIGLGSEGESFFCQFSRPASLTKNNLDYDLSSGEWNVLLATGPVDGGTQTYHGPANRVATSPAASLDSPPMVFIGGVTDISMMKIHGILMFIAWGVLVPSGLFIGRNFRRGYPKAKVHSLPIWFLFHRLLMVISVILTIIGIILIFVNRQGWSQSAAANGHSIAGIVVFVFGLLNPIIAMFRPNPESSNRKIFNICHHSIGYLAQVGAVIAIFLGFDLSIFDVSFATTQIYASTICLQAILAIMLEVFKSKLENSAMFGINSYTIASVFYFLILLPFSIAILVNIGNFTNTQ